MFGDNGKVLSTALIKGWKDLTTWHNETILEQSTLAEKEKNDSEGDVSFWQGKKHQKGGINKMYFWN